MIDLSLDLIKATVEIDQTIGGGRRIVGTGFLISVPRDGANPPEVVLVTAAHVLEKMHEARVRLGWRIEGPAGRWHYQPHFLSIRDANGPMWVQHPTQDIAVIAVEVPRGVTTQGVPMAVLADDRTLSQGRVGPGEEMETLGYPNGLAANDEGFPILRAGRLASWPLDPTSAYPTFLLDLTAVPGNSGGPVFMTLKSAGTEPARAMVTGILTRQVEQDGQRLELGLVAKASFVRQAIAILRHQEIAGGRVTTKSPSAQLGSLPAAPGPEGAPVLTSSPQLVRDMTQGDTGDAKSRTIEDVLPVPGAPVPLVNGLSVPQTSTPQTSTPQPSDPGKP